MEPSFMMISFFLKLRNSVRAMYSQNSLSGTCTLLRSVFNKISAPSICLCDRLTNIRDDDMLLNLKCMNPYMQPGYKSLLLCPNTVK